MLRGAIVSVNERTMITNAAAARLIDEADHSAVCGSWCAGRSLAARPRLAESSWLSTGITVSVRCEPVESAIEMVGALVHLDVPLRESSAKTRPSRKKRTRQSFGWASLSASQLGIAELVASGLTNQEVAARLYLSRHTIDFHLREIYSKLGVDPRVKLARLVSDDTLPIRSASLRERPDGERPTGVPVSPFGREIVGQNRRWSALPTRTQGLSG